MCSVFFALQPCKTCLHHANLIWNTLILHLNVKHHIDYIPRYASFSYSCRKSSALIRVGSNGCVKQQGRGRGMALPRRRVTRGVGLQSRCKIFTNICASLDIKIRKAKAVKVTWRHVCGKELRIEHALFFRFSSIFFQVHQRTASHRAAHDRPIKPHGTDWILHPWHSKRVGRTAFAR